MHNAWAVVAVRKLRCAAASAVQRGKHAKILGHKAAELVRPGWFPVCPSILLRQCAARRAPVAAPANAVRLARYAAMWLASMAAIPSRSAYPDRGGTGVLWIDCCPPAALGCILRGWPRQNGRSRRVA